MRSIFSAAGLAVMALMLLATWPAQSCGPDSDCVIEGAVGERVYRIHMPADHDGTTPVGAIVFAHGAGGSAKGVMKNGALKKFASERGYALIAGEATKRAWSIPGIPSTAHVDGVDENAYFDAVIEDAVSRFPIDRAKLVAAGFSVGGMMVWNLICNRAETYRAFIPVAGVFWQPIPESCPTGAANVFHIHGDDDQMVPLEGRVVRDARQGDVHDVLEMYVRHGGYGEAERVREDDLTCASRVNGEGKVLEFCLFPGGHNFRIKDLRKAWARLEAINAF